MSDLIKRQDVIDALAYTNVTEPYIYYEDAVDAIKRIPAAVSTRKKAHWISYKAGDPDWQTEDGRPIFMVCSNCGAQVVNNFAPSWNFCSSCGAEMEMDDER